MSLNSTFIEWVKNPDGTQGFTCSPKTGCLNHTNGMCKGGGFPCYAHRLAYGRLKERYLANSKIAPFSGLPHGLGYTDPAFDPFYPRWWPERLERIRKRKKPTGIFLNDMSDWMGEYWPEEWTQAELDLMRQCPQHRFYTLTKQPQNLAKFSPFPDNVWLGVTATQPNFMRQAFKYLSEIEAKVKYISMEPLRGMIFNFNSEWFYDSGVSWIIIGSQTRPNVYPKIEWVTQIVKAADLAGVKVFLKDNLKPLVQNHLNNLDIGFETLMEPRAGSWQWRQEMPA